MTNRPGRRATALPTDPKRAARGSRCHDLDGQNTLVPISEMIAGIRVRLASRVTPMAMARAGPMETRKLSEESSSARKQTMTAPHGRGDGLADPADRGDHRGLRVLTEPQPLPVAEHQEQDVVGADAEEHHDQQGRHRTVGLEVELLGGDRDQAVGDLGDERDADDGEDGDRGAAEDDRHQDDDQDDGADEDQPVGLLGGLLVVELEWRRHP